MVKWIDPRMLPSKLTFFLFHCSIGSIMPFLSVFLVSLGLTVRETGVIMAVGYALGILFPPLFGMLADSTRCERTIFFILCIGQGVLFYSCPFVAYYLNPNRVNPNQPINGTSLRTSNLTLRDEEAEHASVYLGPEFSNPSFIAMLVLSSVATGFQFSLMSFIESLVSNVMEHTGTKETFGQQISFSPLGEALASIASGVAADSYKGSLFSTYMGSFHVFLPCMLLTYPLMCVLYNQSNWIHQHTNPSESTETNVRDSKMNLQEKPTESEKSEEANGENTSETTESRLKALKIIFKKPENIVIMLTVLVCGFLRLLSFSVLFLFMKDDMNASETAIGLADASATFTQFVVFPFTHVMMRKLGGPVVCMEIGIASWCVILLSTSFVRDARIAITLQIIQGFNSLFRAAYIQHTIDINSKAVYNTMFSINVCLHFGVGGTLSSLIGGVVYYRFRGELVYQGTCVFGAMWLLFMVIFFHCVRREGRRGQKHGGDDTLLDETLSPRMSTLITAETVAG